VIKTKTVVLVDHEAGTRNPSIFFSKMKQYADDVSLIRILS